MPFQKILLEIESEIARLQQARTLLAGISAPGSIPAKATAGRKPGRPAGRGKLSAQARKRIADAMRKSWAARKKRAQK